MTRTIGRTFIGAEVAPETKARLRAYANEKGISEASALRDVLGIVFSFSRADMASYGAAIDKETKEKEQC